MGQLSALLTPEGETLWIRRPELLLVTDNAYLDKADYDRILARSGRSDLDAKSAALLKAYVEEGYVMLTDYRSILSGNDRSRIFELSRSLIGGMTFAEKQRTAQYGHLQFANYLGAKLEHLNPGEPLFLSTAAARGRLGEYIKKIRSLNEGKDDWPADVAEMQRRAISKWLAGEIIAQRLGTNYVFDLDEYRPYAKLIREKVLTDGTPSAVEEMFPSDVQTAMKVLCSVVKMRLPGISLDGPDDILRFRPSRDEFAAFRGVLRDLMQYHAEVRDESILLKYAVRRFRDAQDEVQALFSRVPRKLVRCLSPCLAYLLNKVCIPLQSQAVDVRLKKSQSRELFKRVEDAYQKLCCFSMYAASAPLPTLTGQPIESAPSGEHWITGAPLSWYEDEATVTGQGSEANSEDLWA